MKKQLLIGTVVLLLVSLIIAGCESGISQEEYDKVKSDLSETQSQVQELEDAYDKVKSDLSEAQSQVQELEDAQDKVNSDLSEAQSQVQELEDTQAKTAAYLEVLNRFFDAARQDMGLPTEYEWTNELDYTFELNSNVAAIGDAELQAKWDAFWAAVQADGGDEEATLFLFYLVAAVTNLQQQS